MAKLQPYIYIYIFWMLNLTNLPLNYNFLLYSPHFQISKKSKINSYGINQMFKFRSGSTASLGGSNEPHDLAKKKNYI